MKDTSSERDWGHHPAGKDQLLEFLGCFIFLCVWNIISDLTLTARIQSGRSNLFKRHNQTEEVIRGSTVLSSTKFFFRIFHQPRNSVVNSAVESAVPARYKKRRFNGQFSAPIPRETKGQTKKNGWISFIFFALLLLRPLSFREKEKKFMTPPHSLSAWGFNGAGRSRNLVKSTRNSIS